MTKHGSRKQREAASDELARLGVKIKTLGAAYARAAESEEDNAFTVIDNLLDPTVSLRTSFRDVIAFWIESFHVQGRLRSDVCATLLDPPAPEEGAGPTSGLVGGELIFVIPPGAQATDPIAIDAPVDQIDFIFVPAKALTAPPTILSPQNVYVSLSSDGKTVQVALINLEQVAALKAGQTCTAQLNLPGPALMSISAVPTG